MMKGQGLYQCLKCGARYGLEEEFWRCRCGGLVAVPVPGSNASTVMSGGARGTPAGSAPSFIDPGQGGIWRYHGAILEVSPENRLTFGEGPTALGMITEFAGLSELEGLGVFVKLEYTLATGSFKDRGASMLLSMVKQWGLSEVVEDSSGNAGAALAAYSGLAGLKATVYVPEGTPGGKLAQMRVLGTTVIEVPGSRDSASAAVLGAAEAGRFYASHNWHPFYLEGTKTFAYEVWEQLRRRAPDAIIVPCGGGSLLLGCYYGFSDLLSWGLINRLPRLYAIQARACSPLHEMWLRTGDNDDENDLQYKCGPTIAGGISVGRPVRAQLILEAVSATGGSVVAVSDEQIVAGALALGKAGHFVEPTSGAAVAGLIELLREGAVTGDETVVLPLTGTGLKASSTWATLLEPRGE